MYPYSFFAEETLLFDLEEDHSKDPDAVYLDRPWKSGFFKVLKRFS